MNFEAYAKLYGYIRFFHPSDEVSEIDWDKFAIYGMKCVESASNINELQNTLNELFHPIAPSLRLHIGERYDYDKSIIIPHDISHLKQVAWQHKGVYLGEGSNLYKSVRVNREKDAEYGQGKIGSEMPAAEFRGKKIKLSGAVKVEAAVEENYGLIWLSIVSKDGKQSFFADKPVISGSWNEYEITAETDEEAELIKYGCSLTGKGRLWFDELKLSVQSADGNWKSTVFDGPFFEVDETGGSLGDWGESHGDYMMTITDTQKYRGSKCAMIEYRGDDMLSGRLYEQMPKPCELLTKKLSGDLY